MADPKLRNARPLKHRCTEGKSGRAADRNYDEEYFKRIKGYHGLEAYKKAMRKRKVWMEPMFAEARQWHGMERVRLRTLEKVNTEVSLTAADQNAKRLLASGPRRPQRMAQAAALRPPGERLHLLHRRGEAQRAVFQHAARNHAFLPRRKSSGASSATSPARSTARSSTRPHRLGDNDFGP